MIIVLAPERAKPFQSLSNSFGFLPSCSLPPTRTASASLQCSIPVFSFVFPSFAGRHAFSSGSSQLLARPRARRVGIHASRRFLPAHESETPHGLRGLGRLRRSARPLRRDDPLPRPEGDGRRKGTLRAKARRRARPPERLARREPAALARGPRRSLRDSLSRALSRRNARRSRALDADGRRNGKRPRASFPSLRDRSRVAFAHDRDGLSAAHRLEGADALGGRCAACRRRRHERRPRARGGRALFARRPLRAS